MTRYEANMTILNTLKEYLEKNPDIRFGQALAGLEIVRTKVMSMIVDGEHYYDKSIWKNDFYTESEEILKRMTK